MIEQYIESDVPVLLWGPPGVGKTAVVAALAADRKAHLEVLIGSTMDPTDLGRPIVDDNGDVTLAPPPWAKRIYGALQDDKDAWLFLDELTCSPPSVQAALLRVVNERMVADLDISGVKIIAAANPTEHAASANDVSAAMANRWAHIDWEVKPNDWIEGELAGWGNPERKLADARSLICGWIDYNNGALLDAPEDGVEDIKGWPSPRAWSNLAKVMGCHVDVMAFMKSSEGRRVVTSLVGGAMASEFIAWTADNDLPKPEELLSGQKKLPKRGDRLMLSVNSCISHAITNDMNDELFKVLASIERKDLCVTCTKRAANIMEKNNIEFDMTDDARKVTRMIREMA
jgi:hypothetical protein